MQTNEACRSPDGYTPGGGGGGLPAGGGGGGSSFCAGVAEPTAPAGRRWIGNGVAELAAGGGGTAAARAGAGLAGVVDCVNEPVTGTRWPLAYMHWM